MKSCIDRVLIHWKGWTYLTLPGAALFVLWTTPVRAAERQTLRGHVPAAVAGLAPAGRLPASQSLNLAIGLPLRNPEALTNLLQQIYDPASPLFRQYLTPQDFTKRFGPSEEDYQALMGWAKANGLSATAKHPNRVLLDVSGSVADIEKALHMTMRLYPHPKEARTFYAPDAEPSLDSSVPVLGIRGLDNYTLPFPKYHKALANNRTQVVPMGGSGPGGNYMGYDFRSAYVPGTSLTGSGQSVGLLEFDGYYPTDVAQYLAQAGLPSVPLVNVYIDGFNGVPGFGNGEVSLDIDMANAMAPGLSQIIVYMAPNPSPWEDLLNRMANDNLAKQLSCSWGGGPPDPVAEQIFLQMAAQGQSFFDAVGDSDAFTGDIPFPAESPNITQVGGTTLTTSGPLGSWVSEKVWNWGNGVGTCGGISTTYSIPVWQQGIDMTTNQGSTTMRNMPDVALTADNIYIIADDGIPESVGGTSCAAPLWAGFTALVNQQATQGAQAPVGFINPPIYALAKGPLYGATFHDITVGNNTSPTSTNRFFAVPGYDLCTGWGTPSGTNLIDILAPPRASALLLIVSNNIFGGNGNGIIDVDECNSLNVTLANFGGATATSVRATLSTTTPGVFIAQATGAYPDLPPGGSGVNAVPFQISTSPAFVCGTPINFTLVAKCDQSATTNLFRLPSGAPGTPVRFDNSTPAAIPGLGETNSTVAVTNINTALNKVTVALYVTYSYDSDLLIQLISPDGTTNTLSANNGSYGQNYGAGCSPDFLRTIFDDAATNSIAAGSAPFVGTFQPQTPLSVFDGKEGTNVNGLWRLQVTDQAYFDVGTLQCWSLFLTPAACTNGGGECPGADLALGMIAQPSPVILGQNLTYTISVTNNGPSSANSVFVTHELPSTVLFQSATSSQGTCSQSGGLVTCNLGSMRPGGTATVTVIVNPGATGTISSTASVTSAQPDPNPSNNSATVLTQVNPASADLAVGLAAVPSPVVVGSTLTYTVSVTNNGPSDASGVTVTNVLPASVAVLSATVSQGSITAGGNFWTIGTLLNGAQATATITVIPTATGSLVATSTVQGNQFDANPANNTATITTTVGASADLAIGITDYPNPVVVLSNVTYVIAVTNLGPSAATGVSVNDFLPVNMPVLSTNATQGAVSISGNTLSWTVGALASGAKATLTIVIEAATNGTLTTTATVAGNQPDPNLANNSATATVVVAAPFVTLVADGASLSNSPNGAINIGETNTVILRLLNTGNVPTRNLVATLLTTAGVTPVPPNNPQPCGVLFPSGFGGFPVGRSFSFTASGTNGGTISPTLQLQDGTNTYPPVSFNFTLPNTFAFANTNGITIPEPAAPDPPYPPESGPAKPYPSVITVTNLTGVLGQVTVTLSNLSHTYPGDINALLVAPSGASALLMSHAGDQPVTGLNLTFNDLAPAGPLPAGGELASGVWQPTAYSPPPQLGGFPANAPAGPYVTALSALNGGNPNGPWSLYVLDDSGGDAGNIANGWSLVLTSIIPVNQIADLGLTAVAAPSTNLVGGTFTYTFTITNAGPNQATTVEFTNVLPAGVTLVSASSSQGNVLTTTPNVIVNLETLNAGATATVSEVVTVTTNAISQGKTSSTVTTVANVAADETDLSPVNNSVTNVTTVNLPVADLGLTQTVAPNPVVVGYSLTNTVVITNNGPNTALSVVLTEPLPTNTILVSVSSTVGSSTDIGGTVTCSLGDLAANAGATVTVVLIPFSPSSTNYVYTNAGPPIVTNISTVYTNATLPWYIHATNIFNLTNTVYVATASQDTNSANNTATTNVTVISPVAQIISAGAALTYESGPVNGAIDPGETVTVSLALANIGSLDTVNLRASLLTSGGVTNPSAPQYYGVLIHGGPSAARSFGFTAASVLSGGAVATLQLQDERPGVTNSLGTVAFAFGSPATTNFSNLGAIIIPDHGAGAPYPSVINVAGLSGRVTKATLGLNGLAHTFPHDVNVLLVSPAGSNVLVMSHTGGGYAVTNINLVFDDAATVSLPNNNLITNGTYKPTSYQGPITLPGTVSASPYQFALSGMNWSNPNGAWFLYVYDDSPGDAGVITGGWTLNLTTVVTVGPVVDLAVGLTVPASLKVGSTLTNTINITNFGPDSATGVVLTLSNPPSADVQFLSASLSQGSLTGASGGLVSCNLGGLAAGGSANVIIVTVPSVAGALFNTVNVAANEEDLNPANNTAQAVTTVINPISATLTGSIVNGQFHLMVTAEPNFVYVVQGSTNLTSTNWVPLFTTTNTTGTFNFTDTITLPLQQRFYRTMRR
ncbi:MAG: protease pro-enzyme activation domain-containing protein [Verrucomicrobiota bacterium]|jgi:uncharacterized repeat protein (TIGR01451 family)